MASNEDPKSAAVDSKPVADTAAASAPAAQAPATAKSATFRTLPGTHTPGTAEVTPSAAEVTTADNSSAEDEPGEPAPEVETMELVALVTRPMPDPVRSGAIFAAPILLARHYIAQGWAIESKPALASETDPGK